jgi:uncharacterized protein YqjF (DUF2071 family)
MQWRDVAFAHWRIDPARIESALPPGLMLDTFDGAAWLSVVPFRMTGVHPVGTPSLPGFADVREINLRTYVRVGERRAVYFFSLDAASWLAVRAARVTTGLPYFDAAIDMSESAGVFTYQSRRTHRGEPHVRFRATYRPLGDAILVPSNSLVAFLHERYSFFIERRGRIVRGDITHAPWQLQSVAFEIETNTLAEPLGITLAGAPDFAAFSRGMAVRAIR